MHMNRLVAKKFPRRSKVDRFTNFQPTPPLELAQLVTSLLATAQRNRAAWFGTQEQDSNAEIAMMH